VGLGGSGFGGGGGATWRVWPKLNPLPFKAPAYRASAVVLPGPAVLRSRGLRRARLMRPWFLASSTVRACSGVTRRVAVSARTAAVPAATAGAAVEAFGASVVRPIAKTTM